MGLKWSKDLQFKIDDQSASIADLTSYTNNASIRGALNLLDDTPFGVQNESTFPGLSSATLPVNGFINSTTAAIWEPLVGERTSITKTAGFYDGVKWITGEFWPEDVEISGQSGQLAMWSVTLRLDDAATDTSVAPT